MNSLKKVPLLPLQVVVNLTIFAIKNLQEINDSPAVWLNQIKQKPSKSGIQKSLFSAEFPPGVTLDRSFSLSSRGCTVSQRGGRRSKMIFNAHKDLWMFSNCKVYQKNTTHLRNVNMKMGKKTQYLELINLSSAQKVIRCCFLEKEELSEWRDSAPAEFQFLGCVKTLFACL